MSEAEGQIILGWIIFLSLALGPFLIEYILRAMEKRK